MVWFRIDDGFYDGPKADAAGTAAIGLWARCGSWAGKHLTDGFVPEATARQYGTPAMIRSLVAANLWDEVPGGYQFHDWHHHNPTKAEVTEARVAANARKRRSRGSHSDVTPSVTRDGTRDGQRESRVTPVPPARRPNPTRPNPTKKSEETARPPDVTSVLPPRASAALASLTATHPLLNTKVGAETARRWVLAGTPIDDLHDALDRLAQAGWECTPGTLQRELSGPPQTTIPSPASAKAQGWSDAADVVRGMRVNGHGATS